MSKTGSHCQNRNKYCSTYDSNDVRNVTRFRVSYSTQIHTYIKRFKPKSTRARQQKSWTTRIVKKSSWKFRCHNVAARTENEIFNGDGRVKETIQRARHEVKKNTQYFENEQLVWQEHFKFRPKLTWSHSFDISDIFCFSFSSHDINGQCCHSQWMGNKNREKVHNNFTHTHTHKQNVISIENNSRNRSRSDFKSLFSRVKVFQRWAKTRQNIYLAFCETFLYARILNVQTYGINLFQMTLYKLTIQLNVTCDWGHIPIDGFLCFIDV